MTDPSTVFEALNKAIFTLNVSRNAAARARATGDTARAAMFDARTAIWNNQAETYAADLGTELVALDNGTITAALFLKIAGEPVATSPQGETEPLTYEEGMYESAMAGSHRCSRGHEHQGWDSTCSECELGCRSCNLA